MQTRLESLFGVPHGHALLMPVLMQQARGVQVQRVTTWATGQPIQTPAPEGTEAPQVGPRTREALKEPREHRLAGDAFDAQQRGHQRIAPQISHLGELARVAKQPVDKGQRFLDGQQVIVGRGPRVGKRIGQRLDPVQRPEPAPEGGAARVRGKPLVGELNGDCFAPGFELKSTGHRLVNRACARRLRCFHTPPISSQSVAPFQLHRSG